MTADDVIEALATIRAARPTDPVEQWLPAYNRLATVWQELFHLRRPYARANVAVAVFVLVAYLALWALIPVSDVWTFIGARVLPPLVAFAFVAINNVRAHKRFPLLAYQDLIERACNPFRAAALAASRGQQ